MRYAPAVFDLSVQFLNRANVVCELLRERGLLASALGGLCGALCAAVPSAAQVSASLAPSYFDGDDDESSGEEDDEMSFAMGGVGGSLRHLFFACDTEGKGYLDAGQVSQLGRALGMQHALDCNDDAEAVHERATRISRGMTHLTRLTLASFLRAARLWKVAHGAHLCKGLDGSQQAEQSQDAH